MKCPYCGDQMKSGVIQYDSRCRLRWRSDGDTRSHLDRFFDEMDGVGLLTESKVSLWGIGRIPGDYCPSCKKLIIETDIIQ